MRPEETIHAALDHAGLTPYAASLRMGRAHSYVGSLLARKSAPTIRTAADVCDVCGVDVVLVDRSTGETIGRVDPRRRGQDDSGDATTSAGREG